MNDFSQTLQSDSEVIALNRRISHCRLASRDKIKSSL